MKNIFFVIIISVGLGAIFGSFYSEKTVRVGNNFYEASSDTGQQLMQQGMSVYDRFNYVIGIQVFGISVILGCVCLLAVELVRSKKAD